MKKLLISALALFVVGSVAAQEGLGETYNKAVAAYNSKDFASAATAFETLIDQGLDSEDLDVQSWVATAKKSVPVCYFQMGLTAAKGNDFNTASRILPSRPIRRLFTVSCSRSVCRIC